MLRYVIGDDSFFGAVGESLRRYRGSEIRIRDFQGIAEEYSRQDLDWFFEEWIYRFPLPDFSLKEVEVSQATEGYKVQGILEQRGDRVKMPVEIALHTEKGVFKERVWIEDKEVGVEIFVPYVPHCLVVDEDAWLLEKDKNNNLFILSYPWDLEGLKLLFLRIGYSLSEWLER